MEFSFKYYEILHYFEAEPAMVVMCAAFGIPLLMFALALPLYIFRKIGLDKTLKPFYSILYIPLAISWIIGFVLMMILLFTGVSGIRMVLIWSLLYLTYLAFGIFNRKAINRWIDDTGKNAINKKSSD
jgi:hypothetical protein